MKKEIIKEKKFDKVSGGAGDIAVDTSVGGDVKGVDGDVSLVNVVKTSTTTNVNGEQNINNSQKHVTLGNIGGDASFSF